MEAAEASPMRVTAPVQATSTEKVTVSLSPEMAERLRTYAAMNRMNRSEVVTEALNGLVPSLKVLAADMAEHARRFSEQEPS
jgi:hypothetical protein